MILYKYYPNNENTWKSLANRGLWCHYPKNMNDPFECLGFIERKFGDSELDKFKKQIEKSKNPKWKRFSNLSNSLLQKALNENRKNSIKNYAFCSRSEEHTSELQSHSFISYAVFCLKKKKKKTKNKIKK